MKAKITFFVAAASAALLIGGTVACSTDSPGPATNATSAFEGDFIATAQSIAERSAAVDTVDDSEQVTPSLTIAIPQKSLTGGTEDGRAPATSADDVAIEPGSYVARESQTGDDSTSQETPETGQNATVDAATETQEIPREATEGPNLITDSEILLTNVWERTIDGVVLITLGPANRSFFSSSGTGAGAGWFWDEDGHIVTNYHVIRTPFGVADQINVETYSGAQYRAEFIGGDEHSDIAVLKVDADPDEFNPLATGDSSSLIPGMTAIALGHPFGPGQAFSMTQGIVSGVARSIQSSSQAFDTPGIIQTDTDMNPGNSGGPLLNSSGEVVGVNTQIRSLTNTNSGVGFAVPVNLVKLVVPDLIEFGRREYSVMGVTMLRLTPDWRERLDLPEDQRGVYISRIGRGGPAEEAGLKGDSGVRELVGDADIIIALDGVTVNNPDDLRQYLVLHTNPGDEVMVEVLRGGEVITIPLTLISRNPPTE